MKGKILTQGQLEDHMHETRASLTSYIYRMVRCKEICQEIFQETWLKVVKYLDDYESSRPFRPWLFTIARNLCLNHIKKEKRNKQKEGMLLLEQDQEGASDVSLDVELLSLCISELPIKYREVVMMRFFDEMNRADLSLVLKVPVGTVNSRLHRGLKLLRKNWEKKT